MVVDTSSLRSLRARLGNQSSAQHITSESMNTSAIYTLMPIYPHFYGMCQTHVNLFVKAFFDSGFGSNRTSWDSQLLEVTAVVWALP
jgi:hypothetical protein